MPILKSIQYTPDRGYKEKNTNILELEKQVIELGKNVKSAKSNFDYIKTMTPEIFKQHIEKRIKIAQQYYSEHPEQYKKDCSTKVTL